METAEVLVLLLLSLAGFGLVARRLRLPEPIILVLGGLLLSLVPGLPRVELAPQYVFLVVLPPLLQAQAWFTSWKDFRDNLRAISMLAIGLVVFTTCVVGGVFHWLLPDLPWAVGFILGAIVSPPDAVAASSIAQRLRLPKRMVAVLEGESLVNDATGLVAFKFAVAALASGAFSWVEAGGRFLVVAGGGLGIGIGLGILLIVLLRRVQDDLIMIVLSLCAPFAAYSLAEGLDVSGVLATVACGLWVGTQATGLLSASARLTGSAFWQTLVFLLNGVVFMLIGLQMPTVVQGLHGYPWRELLGYALAVCGAVVLARIVWIFPLILLARLLSHRFRVREPNPPLRNVAIVAWCGMRGVVSLAAALALPHALPDGRPLPGRDLILFLTFAVILVTLVGQGLSLPWLIRRLGVSSRADDSDTEREARLLAARAGLERIETVARERQMSTAAAVELAALYRERITFLGDDLAHSLGWSPNLRRAVERRQLRRAAVAAERETLLHLHRQHRLDKELLLKLGRELDLEEARLEER